MDILIEELHGSLWVAAVDRGQLRGVEIDPSLERVRYGSIYWARVKRIDAAMDAAFLDLDGENTGLLYNRDVRIKKGKKVTKGGAVAIGKMLTPGQFVLVQARSGYLPRDADEDLPPLEKTPVMTMDLALAGRYLIGTPLEDQGRISQRIRDKKLRRQLDGMIEALPDLGGVILRKAAAHTQTDLIMREGKILRTVWENVERAALGDQPHLIMIGADAVQRTLADQAGARIDHIDLSSHDRLADLQQWAEIFAPDLVTKIRVAEMDDDNVHDLALFMEQNNLMDQFDDLLDPYAVLPGGGNIIIQGTAALTAIDVNAGPDRRGALAVNLEAAAEIARHIKLRNLGGIIVIDFLKMASVTQRRKLIDHLQDQFDDDPCTVQIHGLTKLGLLELTRNRRTPTLAERVQALGIEEE
jgi:Rne/Rng family ribonuclease